MQVTKLIQNIGKCRNALNTRDFKIIMKHLPIFEDVCNKAKIQVDRFIDRDNYEIDFTYHDLYELADETFGYVKNFQTKMLFKHSQKELSKYKKIDNEVLRKFNQQQCDVMYLDRKLREAYKILSYLAVTVWLWTEAREQQELDWQVTQAIRSFL